MDSITGEFMLKKFLRKNKILLGILFLGGALRLLGLKHGFPFIFHPDESTVVRSALGVRFFPNPKHFDWPHLYIYLNYFLYMGFTKVRSVFAAIGTKPFFSSIFPLMWDDTVIFYLLTRTFSALLGTFTIIPVYLTGKELFNKKVGLFSALVLAILPYHVWHSHYSVIDVPMVFFVAWSAYFSSKILKSDKILNYILAGLFVGLAGSTKYHGALSALVLVVAYFGKYLVVKKNIAKLIKKLYKPILAGVFSVLGFLLGTPYALLDWDTFSRTDMSKGAFWQFTNVGSVDFFTQVGQFLGVFSDKFISDWTFAFVLLFVGAMGYSAYLLFKKEVGDIKAVSLLLIFLPALVYIFYISGFEKNRSHYYMISYPFVALSIGWFVVRLRETFDTAMKRNLLLGLLCVPFVFSIMNTAKFVRKDSRVLLHEYFEENAEKFSKKRLNVYYTANEFEQILPEEAEKIEYDSKDLTLKYPYLLVRKCPSSEIIAYSKGAYVIDNTLRRGPKICVKQVAEGVSNE